MCRNRGLRWGERFTTIREWFFRGLILALGRRPEVRILQIVGFMTLAGCLAVAGMIALPAAAHGQDVQEALQQMQQQIQELQQRLAEQERLNADLSQRLEAQEAQAIVPEVQRPETQQLEPKVAVPAQEEPMPAIRSKFPAEFYGYIKLDMSYDTAHTDTGNFARWVLSEMEQEDDGQFNITANQTRLGLKFAGPTFDDLKISGKVEVDFYGGNAENKAHLMMRHAYVQMDWPEHDFSILAGQSWDVISPILQNTVNYSVGWWAGDIGYRRPQLRLTKGFGVFDDSRLQLELAASRTIGHTSILAPGDAGEDGEIPTMQGRIAYEFPGLGGRKTIVGLSGHYGQEQWEVDNAGDHEDIDTWSGNVDLTLPLLEWLTFKGSAWMGENVDAYLGGIGQGIVVTYLDDEGVVQRRVNASSFDGEFLGIEEIEALGGFAQLGFGPFGKWRYHLGAGIDDPEDDDLPSGARSQNYNVYGNVMYSMNEAISLGFELSYWNTEYKEMEDGDNIRVQTAVTYAF